MQVKSNNEQSSELQQGASQEKIYELFDELKKLGNLTQKEMSKLAKVDTNSDGKVKDLDTNKDGNINSKDFTPEQREIFAKLIESKKTFSIVENIVKGMKEGREEAAENKRLVKKLKGEIVIAKGLVIDSKEKTLPKDFLTEEEIIKKSQLSREKSGTDILIYDTLRINIKNSSNNLSGIIEDEFLDLEKSKEKNRKLIKSSEKNTIKIKEIYVGGDKKTQETYKDSIRKKEQITKNSKTINLAEESIKLDLDSSRNLVVMNQKDLEAFANKKNIIEENKIQTNSELNFTKDLSNQVNDALSKTNENINTLSSNIRDVNKHIKNAESALDLDPSNDVLKELISNLSLRKDSVQSQKEEIELEKKQYKQIQTTLDSRVKALISRLGKEEKDAEDLTKTLEKKSEFFEEKKSQISKNILEKKATSGKLWSENIVFLQDIEKGVSVIQIQNEKLNDIQRKVLNIKQRASEKFNKLGRIESLSGSYNLLIDEIDSSLEDDGKIGTKRQYIVIDSEFKNIQDSEKDFNNDVNDLTKKGFMSISKKVAYAEGLASLCQDNQAVEDLLSGIKNKSKDIKFWSIGSLERKIEELSKKVTEQIYTRSTTQYEISLKSSDKLDSSIKKQKELIEQEYKNLTQQGVLKTLFDIDEIKLTPLKKFKKINDNFLNSLNIDNESIKKNALIESITKSFYSSYNKITYRDNAISEKGSIFIMDLEALSLSKLQALEKGVFGKNKLLANAIEQLSEQGKYIYNINNSNLIENYEATVEGVFDNVLLTFLSGNEIEQDDLKKMASQKQYLINGISSERELYLKTKVTPKQVNEGHEVRELTYGILSDLKIINNRRFLGLSKIKEEQYGEKLGKNFEVQSQIELAELKKIYEELLFILKIIKKYEQHPKVLDEISDNGSNLSDYLIDETSVNIFTMRYDSSFKKIESKMHNYIINDMSDSLTTNEDDIIKASNSLQKTIINNVISNSEYINYSKEEKSSFLNLIKNEKNPFILNLITESKQPSVIQKLLHNIKNVYHIKNPKSNNDIFNSVIKRVKLSEKSEKILNENLGKKEKNADSAINVKHMLGTIRMIINNSPDITNGDYDKDYNNMIQAALFAKKYNRFVDVSHIVNVMQKRQFFFTSNLENFVGTSKSTDFLKTEAILGVNPKTGVFNRYKRNSGQIFLYNETISSDENYIQRNESAISLENVIKGMEGTKKGRSESGYSFIEKNPKAIESLIQYLTENSLSLTTLINEGATKNLIKYFSQHKVNGVGHSFLLNELGINNITDFVVNRLGQSVNQIMNIIASEENYENANRMITSSGEKQKIIDKMTDNKSGKKKSDFSEFMANTSIKERDATRSRDTIDVTNKAKENVFKEESDSVISFLVGEKVLEKPKYLDDITFENINKMKENLDMALLGIPVEEKMKIFNSIGRHSITNTSNIDGMNHLYKVIMEQPLLQNLQPERKQELANILQNTYGLSLKIDLVKTQSKTEELVKNIEEAKTFEEKSNAIQKLKYITNKQIELNQKAQNIAFKKAQQEHAGTETQKYINNIFEGKELTIQQIKSVKNEQESPIVLKALEKVKEKFTKTNKALKAITEGLSSKNEDVQNKALDQVTEIQAPSISSINADMLSNAADTSNFIENLHEDGLIADIKDVEKAKNNTATIASNAIKIAKKNPKDNQEILAQIKKYKKGLESSSSKTSTEKKVLKEINNYNLDDPGMPVKVSLEEAKEKLRSTGSENTNLEINGKSYVGHFDSSTGSIALLDKEHGNLVLIGIGGEQEALSLYSEEKQLLQENPEGLGSFAKTREAFKKANITNLWPHRMSLFKGLENAKGTEFNLDKKYLSEKELIVMLDSILISVGEQPGGYSTIEETIVHFQKANKSTGGLSHTEDVNSYGDSTITDRFITKFMPREQSGSGFQIDKFKDSLN